VGGGVGGHAAREPIGSPWCSGGHVRIARYRPRPSGGDSLRAVARRSSRRPSALRSESRAASSRPSPTRPVRHADACANWRSTAPVLDAGSRRASIAVACRRHDDDRRRDPFVAPQCSRGPPVRIAKLQEPGAPVRTAKRTNRLLERGRASRSSTITDNASSSRHRSFERALRGTGDRRRRSTRGERGGEWRPISRVDRLFAPRSGRTGFLNGAAHRRSRRSLTVARRVPDAHRRGQFVSLSLVRTGGPRLRFSTTDLDEGPRHRFSTTELDECLRHGCSTTDLDEGQRHTYSTTDLDGCRTRTRPATDFPRGPPVRAAKRTNWLVERERASRSPTLTDEASSSRYRSFEPAVRGAGNRRGNSTAIRGTGNRRRISTGVGQGRDRRPISRVDRLFAPQSGRTGFLNGAAHRRSRRSLTVARRVPDAHRRGQFVSLSLVRTGGPRLRFSTTDLDEGPRHRFSTTELDEGLRHGCSTTDLDEGQRHTYSTTDLDGGRTRTRPATDFPRGPPVRAAKRTNWLLERGRAARSSTITFEAGSSRSRSFELAVRGAGSRRRSSTRGERGGERRPISRVDRPFASRSERTGFLNAVARRSSRRPSARGSESGAASSRPQPTRPVRHAEACANWRSTARVLGAGGPSSDHRSASEPARGVIGLRAVVVREHAAVATVAEKGAAEGADVFRRRDPTGRLQVELAQTL
jgi:hypothetical protein